MNSKKKIKTLNELTDSRILYEKDLPFFGYIIIIITFASLLSVIIWSIKAPKTYIVSSPGMVESENKNYIMSGFSGEITSINIFEGANVEKGDVLLTIKSTDLNLQEKQIEGQKESYEKQVAQYQKLVKSIRDDKNYFSSSNPDDNLFYSQFESYKSQLAQNEVDATAYKMYGYSDEQIESEIVKNQNKMKEIYYSAIKSAEEYIQQCNLQLDAINSQLSGIQAGKNEFTVYANTSGKVHMSMQYKEGMVIQAGSAIGSIAAEQDEYSVQAYISTNDVARINVGDEVDIAISGLSQTIYGNLTGRVEKIDSDITVSQNEQTGQSSSYFKAEVSLDDKYLVGKKGDKINISNGMAVETRIKYDKVTYFEYVLDALGVLSK